jgi:hypothetical protein
MFPPSFRSPRYKSINGSGWVVQKHATFDPASQKQLDSRLRSPLPSVKEPCPLSLPYGFFTTQPEPFSIMVFKILYSPIKEV